MITFILQIVCVCVCELLSRAQLFVTPWTVALKALLPMGFSRQEYWSGLPFPSPGNLLDSEIKPECPALQADSLLSELPGKPKNTGVGSLFLLQWISPTQELNQDLLHCRQILYQLSSQGSPLGPREKTMTSQKPRTDLPACLIESSGEVGAAVAHCRDKDIGGRGTREYSLV